jgi:23S rRNA (adenine2503-C2)-methyltransferase
MKSFYSLTYPELTNTLISMGYKEDSASKLYNWHYKKRLNTPCEFKIPNQLKNQMRESFDFSLPLVSNLQKSSDETVKFLFDVGEGQSVESVLIPFHNKYSLCISSQVGCAMNCSFCYTGKQGFKRNLTTSEIIGQYLGAWNWLAQNRTDKARITNVVFMGQGEPLHNFDEVKKACEILLSQHGLSLGAQKITVSTSGYLPGLKRWKDEMPGVNLALSLHSPFEEKRSELIPINRAFPLDHVLEEIDKIPLAKKQFVTYEYLMISDFNISEKDAHSLGELLQGKDAYINLIPFNPFPGSIYNRPQDYEVEEFKSILDTYRIPTLIRKTKGDEVLAACGQLNTKILK